MTKDVEDHEDKYFRPNKSEMEILRKIMKDNSIIKGLDKLDDAELDEKNSPFLQGEKYDHEQEQE